MKIKLFQLKPVIGNIEENLKKIEYSIEIANKENIQIIAFPELFLTGYPLEDRIFFEDLKLQTKKAIKKILDKSKKYFNLTICLGTPFFAKKTYNACLVIQNGKIIHKIFKSYLPDYGVFNESRYFTKGTKAKPFKVKDVNILLSICEEIWNDDYIKYVNKIKPDFILSINASPFEKEKFEKRIERVKLLNAPTIYLNSVLGYEEIIFEGRSFVFNKKLLFEANTFEEDIFDVTYKNHAFAINNIAKKEENLIYKALVFGLREYCLQNGFLKVLIGISGGIDSALCAKIATDALGNKNVLGVMLPSKISSKESKKDAIELAKYLNINLQEFSIKEAFEEVKNTLNINKDLSLQNLQSRIRGTMLMALANESGALLLTTGNKTELAIGYATIYGDMNGGFNPIKDLFKTEVFNLCKSFAGFPKNILNKSPTAELKENQTDEHSIGLPYEVLDEILKEIIINKSSLSSISKLKILTKGIEFRKQNNFKYLSNKKIVQYVFELLKKAEFKRNQAPPGTKLSKTSFGRDWKLGAFF